MGEVSPAMEHLALDGYRHLPAADIAHEVNQQLAQHPCLVITAPPGAGKSTLLPLTMLAALPKGQKILMLEPRRMAARQIAERMAQMLDEPVGQTVGYRIRFEQRTSAQTRIEVLTEGILTRMLVDDPALEGVALVIFDEHHERSLASDVAMALTREAQAIVRPDLRIVVMSATIDTATLCATLNAPLVQSQGSMFPVEVRRAPDEATPDNAAELVAQTVRTAHRNHEGDILAFLPGEADIRRCTELLGASLGNTRVMPLYGMLSSQEQRQAIAPSPAGQRKVVLATPIAETSITIEGVRVVVDSGLCRRMVFDAQSALSRLETVRISFDMAQQRAGRAGRVAPGVCYRLWSTATEGRMAQHRTPEIAEADLAPMALDIAAWGEAQPERLPWLTPPPAARIAQAQRLLRSLGATDEANRITPHGRTLAALPCHPRMAQMLVQANSPKLKALAADMAALLEERDPLANAAETGLDLRIAALRRARSGKASGAWGRIARVAEQYLRLVHAQADNTPPDPYEVGALLAHAFPERIGKAWHEGNGRFLLANGELAAIEPTDPLASSEWLAVAHLSAKKGGMGRIFMAAPIAPNDLQTLAQQRDSVFWDSKRGAAIAQRETRIGGLLLSARPLHDVPRERIAQVIGEATQKEGASMLDLANPDLLNLQRRIAAVAAWHPELTLPDLSTESVLQRAPEWLPLYIGRATTTADLKRIDLRQALWAMLSYEQQQAVDRIAPTHIGVPTGSHIAVEYRQGAEAPVLRVRLQECFGLLDTPRVDDGRRPVLMELLSPGYKPVQLTSDLRSFWSTTYFEVRKELRRRYPKHSWPDDPVSAEAVRGVKRKD